MLSRFKPRAHFLHIGKTAGTAVIEALTPLAHAGRYRLEMHDHGMGLPWIPVGEPFFFAVRDPIDRFVSGFYGRQRKDRPRYNVEWTPEEAQAFATFATANDLGEGLASPDAQIRQRAERAMRSIGHVNDSYWRVFVNETYFRSRALDLLFVADQASLSEDFRQLAELLGLAGRPQLPRDATGAHRSPSNIDRGLSDTARDALTQWYSKEYRFLEVVQELKDERGGTWSRMRSDSVPHRAVRLGQRRLKRLLGQRESVRAGLQQA